MKRYYTMHQNNECLLVLAMYYVYNKFLKKIWNLPLNFAYFDLSVKFGPSCWLSIFMLYQPGKIVL